MNYSYDRRIASPQVAKLPPKIDSRTKQKINQELIKKGLGGKARYRKMGQAITAAFDVLAKFGIETDETLRVDNFGGDQGNRAIRIAWSNKDDSFSPISIRNTMLALSWTKLDDDRYEVIGYLS